MSRLFADLPVGADYIPVCMASCTFEHSVARGACVQANRTPDRLVGPRHYCSRNGRLDRLATTLRS